MDSSDVDEIKRHFNVVAEGLDSKIQLVAEAVSGVSDHLDRVDNRLDGIDTRLDTIDIRLNSVDVRLHGIDTRLGGTDSRLDTALNTAQSEQESLRARVQSLENR
jgi:archaellum component FlaC